MNGQIVRVWTSTFSDNITASSVALPHKTDTSSGVNARLSGVVSDLLSGVSFKVAGIKVLLSSATTIENASALLAGAYVSVKGAFNATREVAATQVKALPVEANQLYLLGYMANLDSSAKTLSVRTVAVDYRVATLSPCTCVLANGLAVSVRATYASATSLVSASTIQCEPGRSIG